MTPETIRRALRRLGFEVQPDFYPWFKVLSDRRLFCFSYVPSTLYVEQRNVNALRSVTFSSVRELELAVTYLSLARRDQLPKR